MIAFKLALQSLAGVVALGGAIAGTVVLTKNPKSEEYERPITKTTEVDLDSQDQTAKAFYLVSSAVGIADRGPTKDLFTNANQTEKNYKCISRLWTSETAEEIITKDSSCIFYSLKSTTSTRKTSEIKTWTQNKTSDLATKVIKKSEIKEKKFFLLEGHKNLIEFAVNNRQPIIYLTKKNTNDFFEQSNYYVMLKVHAKISGNELTGSTDTFIAKATAEQQTTNTEAKSSMPSYQCSFKLEDPKTDCALSKLSGYTSESSINFGNQTIKSMSGTTTTEKDSYYLIKTDEIIPNEIQSLKGTTATYIETQSQNSTTTTLNIETAVFAKFNNNDTKITELIIFD